MKVIIQAGGLGTRMKTLTASKPKALIAVQNKPILFHLFDDMKGADFIIVGDYKYDVLDHYIATFAKDVNCILVKAKGKGNVAGLTEALSYVPDNETVMIIWSDLILPDGFKVNENIFGCQVGTVGFACSWQFADGCLKHEKVEVGEGRGVAGLYIFDNKSRLETLPEEGSFTTWLSQQTFPMTELPLDGCKDVGTLQAYQQLDNSKYRCRPYNKIEVKDDIVVKSGLTKEAETFIAREVDWYTAVSKYGFKNAPKLLETNPMTLERIKGQNLFLCSLNIDGKRATFKRVVDALAKLHSYDSKPADSWDLYREYFTKTLNRLYSIASALPFSLAPTIRINGRDCKNVLVYTELFRRAVLDTLMNTHYTPFHGDCQLTNTLLDEAGDVYFIDARGYFGSSKVLGDPRYDWAKLYYAIEGNFDQFNVKNFTFEQNDDEVSFEIGASGWGSFTDELFNVIPSDEGNRKEIELIHSIVWLSMASHVWEDYDSMCVAFYNGVALFNKWMEDYSYAS